jgi:hypothetical protein
VKPSPPPRVPGNTEAERMDNAVRKMFSVPKEDVLKKEAEWKKMRGQRNTGGLRAKKKQRKGEVAEETSRNAQPQIPNSSSGPKLTKSRHGSLTKH